MRLVTAARLRAVGLLLLEAAGFVLLISERLGDDTEVRSTLGKLWAKAKAL